MARLIFFVARSGMIDVGEAVERQHAVAFKSWKRGIGAIEFLVGLMTGLRSHRVHQASTAGDELNSRVKQSGIQAVMKSLMKIPHGPQFFFNPAFLDFLRIYRERF